MDILLDWDGVMVDFQRAACRVHGVDPPWTWDRWPADREGMYDMVPLLNITPQEFWAKIDEVGEEFWASIPYLPWHGELLDLCRSYGHVTICTTPSLCHTSAAGKVIALKREFGPQFRDYILTPRKGLCAAGDRVLIDDSDENIRQFRDAGGMAICFPSPWNRYYNHANSIEQRLAVIDDKLSAARAVLAHRQLGATD